MYSLAILPRLTQSTSDWLAYTDDLTVLARGWERTILAIKGYGWGSFKLGQEDLTLPELKDVFYGNLLGNRLVETTLGIDSWEGLLYEFRLVIAGREYRRTLTPEWWHNKMKVVYSYPTAEDNQIGNLTYNPVANSFQDDGQDFSEWETLAGDATYSISVTNSDGTTAWGFLGASFTTTNANDSVYVYTDVELTDAGWNGEVSGKTPSTYEVSSTELAGERQDTGWSENTDASAEYGVMEYMLTLGGAAPEAAEALRDRELTAFAWPRSRKMGGGATSSREDLAALEVSVAGYWETLNWTYRATSRIATASDLVTTVVGESEFVTAGRIETNEMRVKADCEPVPKRRGDLIEDIIKQGDLDGNIWQGGVYAGQKLVYEAAPTAVRYLERGDGVLTNLGRTEVVPSLMEAGFLLLDESAPSGGQPPGTSGVWDDPRVGYVDEVRFVAPDTLEYQLMDEEESVTAFTRKIQELVY
jgi:hypothetical protein